MYSNSITFIQLEYQKDYRTSLKEFHQVSDSVAQQQMTRAAGLASESGYRTAPQDMESVGQGYQHQPPPQSKIVNTLIVYSTAYNGCG